MEGNILRPPAVVARERLNALMAKLRETSDIADEDHRQLKKLKVRHGRDPLALEDAKRKYVESLDSYEKAMEDLQELKWNEFGKLILDKVHARTGADPSLSAILGAVSLYEGKTDAALSAAVKTDKDMRFSEVQSEEEEMHRYLTQVANASRQLKERMWWDFVHQNDLD